MLVLLLIAIAQQVAAPVRDVPREKGRAAISGRVTERSSGRPLPRIVVSLRKPNASTPLETLTDGDGRYQFTNVEPGAYALSAGLDRHRSTYLPHRYGADTPGVSSFEPQRPNLDLKPGEARTGLDFALWRALAIEGRVLDPWEMGMANVSVIVKRATERVRASAYISTDDRGKYRAYGLAPGRYRVCAEIDQQSDAAAEAPRLAATCYPAAVDGANAGEVVLTSDDATGVDVRVQQSRAYSLSLSGSVVDASGAVVRGAFVGAYPLDDRGSTASQTTRDGGFVLTGLAPGRYIVRASSGETTPDDPRGDRAQVGYAVADLSAGDAAGVVVPLSNPVDVAGRVTFEGERAGIRKPGMVVQTSIILPQRLTFATSRPPFSPLDDDLAFKLSRVYRLPLIVGMTGLPDGWVVKSVRFDGRDVTYVPTDFGARPDPPPLEIVLTKRVARAVVRVLDQQGAPASSFEVVAVPTDPSRWALPFAIVPATREDSELTKLGPMLPGDYFVAALSRDDWLWLLRDRGRIDAIASVGTRVTLGEGDTRKLELRIVTLLQ